MSPRSDAVRESKKKKESKGLLTSWRSARWVQFPARGASETKQRRGRREDGPEEEEEEEGKTAGLHYLVGVQPIYVYRGKRKAADQEGSTALLLSCV